MKFLTTLSLFTTAIFSTFTNGEKDDISTIALEQQEKVASVGNLRKNNDHRALTESLSIPTESRIVGGKDAPDDAYPFFVSWGDCGASLVADNVILSAAHCKWITTDEVIIGQSRKKNNNSNGVTRKIIKRTPHPKYSKSSSTPSNYDYLVMQLDEAVNTAVYPPIGLNSQSNIPANRQELTVIGFGTLSQGGSSTPDNLQEVDVKYIPSKTCNRGFLSYNGDVKDATMFCAGTNGGKDSCQGDSGGPIFTKGESIEQVGIVSWGRGCAQRRYPGVYSRISGEYNWIKAQVCNLANTPPAYCNNDSPGSEIPAPVTPAPEIPAPVTPALEIPATVTPAPVTSAPDSLPDLPWFLQQVICSIFKDSQFCNQTD